MSSSSSHEGDAGAESQAYSLGSQQDQIGDELRDLTLGDRQLSANSLSEAGGGGGEASTLFDGEVRSRLVWAGGCNGRASASPQLLG